MEVLDSEASRLICDFGPVDELGGGGEYVVNDKRNLTKESITSYNMLSNWVECIFRYSGIGGIIMILYPLSLAARVEVE